MEENMKNLLAENNWSNSEMNFLIHQHQFKKNLCNQIITLKDEFETKLRLSFYGIFLNECNPTDQQSEELLLHKLGILKWDLKHKEYLYKHEYFDLIENRVRNEEFFEKECTCLNNLVFKQFKWITLFDNNFTDDPLGFLERIILENGHVDIPTVYKDLKFLRVVSHRVTVIDKTLSQFKSLEILNLPGNYISDIPWQYVPKKLKFFQLYSNFITSLWSISKSIASGLVFLGLGRNLLNNRSGFHLLADYAKHLHALDFSENNIENLELILSSLCLLPHLRHLNLEGNPCAVTIGYKDAVIAYIKGIKTLDCTILKPTDHLVNPIYEPLLHNYTGCLVFTCYKIMGLLKPPNEVYKKEPAQSWFYLQLEAPLLDPYYRNGNTKKEVHEQLDKKKQKKITKGSIYARDNEYENDPDEQIQEFVSRRKAYASRIEFDNPTIIIPAPDNDLTALRDTFRSAVTVKLMYCVTYQKEIEVPKDSSKSTKVRREDVIFKKITIDKFQCHLKQVNWSDDAMDYYWDELQPDKANAVAVEGTLKFVRYGTPRQMRNEGKNAKKKGKDVPKKDPDKLMPCPTFLTIQVGFGIARLDLNETKPKKKNSNKSFK